VQDGLVLGKRDTIATGDDSDDNRVIVRHFTEEEVFTIPLEELLAGHHHPRYASVHLHLDGPGLIPVSQGMFVRQGARLGVMDDTGISVDHHLHFSIHDRDIPNQPNDRPAGDKWPPGRSVRPSPMDGQLLLDSNDGACVSSTNDPHDADLAPPVGAPQISFNPASVGFGPVPVGDVRIRSLRIRNEGLVDVNISFPAPLPPFLGSAFSAVIPPGGERMEWLQFLPPAEGFAEQTLLAQSNALGSPHSIRLSGTGTKVGVPL
jgi:hypothetical protein